MKKIKNYSNKTKEIHVQLSKPFMYLIGLFHFMGLSLFSRTKFYNRYQKFWHLKWCFFNIILFSIVHFLICYYHRQLFYIGDNFGQFNDFIKVVTVGISHLITLIETIVSQKSCAEFFHIYTQLHQRWANYKETKKEFKIYKKLFLLLLFYIITTLLIELNYVFEIYHKKQWLAFFLAYEPSVTVCRFRLLQIMMYLYMIMIEILQLNKEMLSLVDMSRKTQLNLLEEIIYKDLSLFMQKYQQIYLMMELFKKSCSISLLIILIKSYVKILSDSYWTYWVIYNKYDVYEFVEYSLIVPTALSAFLTLIISKDCMNAAKLIPHSLHSLRHRVENVRLSYKIQNFSLQMRHQQIIIDAFGCFTVDCYIVSGIVGSITTYLIFYIEFMPKFKNL
ncbi:gustatory receptor 8a-like [Cochliomyia hominivorax]